MNISTKMFVAYTIGIVLLAGITGATLQIIYDKNQLYNLYVTLKAKGCI